jgi:hypothetical protein
MHSQLYTADPRIPGMAYGFFEDVVNGQRIISHGGDTVLFHSGLFLLPEQNVGLYFSTNAVGGGRVGDGIAYAFADHYFPVEKAADPVPTTDFDSRAAKYAGEYYSARNNFTGFEKFFSLLSPIFISVDENKNVLLSEAGQTKQYVEVEPGILVNREHPDERAVLKEKDGQITIHPSAPFVFVKKTWYEALSLHLLILVGGAVLFGLTLLRWLIAFFAGLFKREPRPFLARLARAIGELFALSYLLFLLVLAAVLLDIDPAFGVPKLLFEAPAGIDIFMKLPFALVVLAILMVPFAIIAWAKRYWTFGARFSYTFLTLLAFAIVWSMMYWNLLLF